MVNRFLFLGLVITTIVLYSCVGERKEDCKRGEKAYRKDTIEVVLTEKPSRDWYYFLEGNSLKTGEDTIYKFEGRWYGQLGDYWDVGDTIIKRKGELFLEIHKKGIIHISEWTCEGVFIDGTSVRELARRKKYGK